MTNTAQIAKASFKIRGGSTQDKFDVHFNPSTLRYTISNNMKNTGSGNSAKQYVDNSTGQLTMDLIFDTTSNGEDVRLHSVRVAKLMEPKQSDKTPPIVEFAWGLYTFAGMMQSYTETIDFFSADGVPLRASVNLTLASQDKVFEGGSNTRKANTGKAGALGRSIANYNSVQTPAPPKSDGRGLTQTATTAGNPAAARQIAAQNGVENMRFPDAAPLQITGGAVATGVSSLTASANTGGRFASLHVQNEVSANGALSLSEFLGSTGTASLGTEDAAGFSLGGQARLQGSASFKADVGKGGALKAKIEFDGGE
jgi:hypothetical protein